MRIISDFKDYYDCLMNPADKVHYIRKECEIGASLNTLEDKYSHPKSFRINVAGVVYAIYCETQDVYHKKWDIKIHDIESLHQHYDNLNPKYINEWQKKSAIKAMESDYIELERQNKSGRYLELCHQFKCPLMLAYWKWNSSRAQEEEFLVLNPRLNLFGFQKIVSPALMYMEIDRFINNMASPEKPIPYIDDVTMAETKGFDKYSFRKDKAR